MKLNWVKQHFVIIKLFGCRSSWIEIEREKKAVEMSNPFLWKERRGRFFITVC